MEKKLELIADDIIIIEHFLTCDKEQLLKEESYLERDIMIADLEHVLNKIKEWKKINNIK